MHRRIAVTLIFVVAAAVPAGCGGGDDKPPSRSKDESQKRGGPDAILAEAITDMEKFIPEDLNGQMRADGQAFRVRSIDCTPDKPTFTATCAVQGNQGNSYAAKVKVKRSNGSYTYNCPDCP